MRCAERTRDEKGYQRRVVPLKSATRGEDEPS
jgi:hypothetical protein